MGTGAITNLMLGVTLGYELSEKWLLTGSVGLDFLDAPVRQSPIIERDELWFATVGVAYNTSLFEQRERKSDQSPRSLELRLGVSNSTFDTKVTRSPGLEVDLEDVLGAPDKDSVVQFDTRLRLGYYHRLEFTAFQLERGSSATAGRDVMFGGQLYPAGSQVKTSSDLSLIRLGYSYSLIRDAQKELGLSVGVSFLQYDGGISGADPATAQQLSVDTNSPTLGALASIALGENWTIEANGHVFALDFDRYDGWMSHVGFGLDRKFGATIRAGIGLNFFNLHLNSNDEQLAEEVRFRQYGPKIYVSATF